MVHRQGFSDNVNHRCHVGHVSNTIQGVFTALLRHQRKWLLIAIHQDWNAAVAHNF